MKAVDRWKEAFISQLECVGCRRKENLRFTREFPTVDDFKANLDKVDVLCYNCENSLLTQRKMRSEARRVFKEEAAVMADLKVMRQRASVEDEYVLNDVETTREEILAYVESLPCFCCGAPGKVFRNFDKSTKGARVGTVILNSNYSIEHVEAYVETGVAFCDHCYKMYQTDEIELPKKRISLDQFWESKA